MATTNEMVAAGEMKMHGGFGKFHAISASADGYVFAALCGASVFANRAVVESASHINCARCLARLGRA